MRPYQPAVAALALAALVPLAGAADAATPAAGTATSTATLATLTAVGKQVDIAQITSTAGNVSGLLAKISVAPLAIDGEDVVDAVTVEAGGDPVTVPSVSSPAALAPIASVSSPALTLSAASGDGVQTSGLKTPSGLGSLSVLGLDLTVEGSLKLGSLVDGTQSEASKTIEISELALPSVADILASLGLDIAKLPADTLQALISELDLAIAAAGASANALIDAAQVTADTAATTATSATSALTAAQTASTAASTAAAASALAFEQAVAAIVPATSMDEWNTLADPAQELLSPTANAAEATAAEDAADASTAAAAVTTAQTAVNTAQAALNTALTALSNLVATVSGAVSDALGDTPLVSLGSAKVGTTARVDSAKTAEVIGEVTGLEVLGTDVLELATGSSTLDLAKTATELVADINGEIAGTLGTLSSVLEDVAGVSFPAPVVKLLQKTTQTGVDGAFGTAEVTVSVLDISIPAVSLPENVVLESVLNAVELADHLEIVDGVLEASAFALKVGTLTEAARFRPAAITPGTTPPAPGSTPAPGSLPTTGAPFGLALLAAAGVAGAVVLRRASLARAEG